MNETKTTKIARPIAVLPITALANTLVNRFKGFISMTEPQRNAVGMRFATICFKKPMKMRKFHRTEKTADNKKLPNPYINNAFEVGKISIDLNAIWQNAVNNKANRENGEQGEFEANKTRNNGILNYLDSRVVCHKIKETVETFYLNYIVADYIGETVYVNSDNETLDYADLAEYHSQKSQASKEKEAKKHDLTVETDVQIRQMKFENITKLSIFGTDYVPQTSATEVVDVEAPEPATTKATVKA